MFPISTERETSLEKSCVMRTLVGFGVFFILSWFVDFVYIPLIFFFTSPLVFVIILLVGICTGYVRDSLRGYQSAIALIIQITVGAFFPLFDLEENAKMLRVEREDFSPRRGVTKKLFFAVVAVVLVFALPVYDSLAFSARTQFFEDHSPRVRRWSTPSCCTCLMPPQPLTSLDTSSRRCASLPHCWWPAAPTCLLGWIFWRVRSLWPAAPLCFQRMFAHHCKNPLLCPQMLHSCL